MRAGLLALAISLAAPGPAPTPAGAQGPADRPRSPWVLVQVDGTRVVLEAPPEARSGRLVGRLRGGALVSIPASRVDAAATARANSGDAGAAPARPPAAVPTPRPFETPPLGDRVRLRRSAEDARRLLEAARGGTPAPTARPGARPTVPAPLEEAEPTDLNGHGEAWWRGRAERARADLEEAGRALAEAESALESAERAYLGVSEAERTTFVLRLAEARGRAEWARGEERRAAARWDELQEEARKAGAFPGWLR